MGDVRRPRLSRGLCRDGPLPCCYRSWPWKEMSGKRRVMNCHRSGSHINIKHQHHINDVIQRVECCRSGRCRRATCAGARGHEVMSAASQRARGVCARHGQPRSSQGHLDRVRGRSVAQAGLRSAGRGHSAAARERDAGRACNAAARGLAAHLSAAAPRPDRTQSGGPWPLPAGALTEWLRKAAGV